jgi:hypothetical protein
MQELRYMDTVAEKWTKTVLRQKCTTPETTHDNEDRKHAVTAEKSQKRVSQQKNLARPKYCLSYFFDFGAAYTAL